MFSLPLSLAAAQQDQTHNSFKKAFQTVFKGELKTIDPNLLPLQQGLQYSSYANTADLTTAVLKCTVTDNEILVKAFLFYSGTIAGCSCADDPSPLDIVNEQCEALFIINRSTAETSVTLV